MGFAKIKSAQTDLLSATIIDIEADVTRGIHSFSIIGLPDKAVEESRDRISSAIKHCGYPSPKHSNQKVVISLAPAHIPKNGPHFDLAIAIAYLVATEAISKDLNDSVFLGELSLDGKLRCIRGVLPIVSHIQKSGIKKVFLPVDNCAEASLVDDIEIYGVNDLKELCQHLEKNDIKPYKNEKVINIEEIGVEVDMSQIKGQEDTKRALLIAMAGGHNIALWGPPGTGKTMLAKASCGIMPDLTFEESIEVTSIYSVMGLLKKPLINRPPFRSPHHTASYTALVGGGTIPKPGEITLSHKGILFLDEFPEFDQKTLETLREPMEEHSITISRTKTSGSFPADFVLIAAMNPCPCGKYGVKNKDCTCSSITIDKYRKKISGPITDRISMWVEVSSIEYQKFLERDVVVDKTEDFKKKIIKAREIQKERSIKNLNKNLLNGRIREIPLWFNISDEAKDILNISAEKFGISGRSYRNTVSVARTIADLKGKEVIEKEEILESLQYRIEKV